MSSPHIDVVVPSIHSFVRLPISFSAYFFSFNLTVCVFEVYRSWLTPSLPWLAVLGLPQAYYKQRQSMRLTDFASKIFTEKVA